MARTLTDEQIRALHARYMADPNETLDKLAESVFVARPTISNYFRALGLETRRGARSMLDDERARAAYRDYMADDGMSIERVAAVYRVSDVTLRKYWRRMGLESKQRRRKRDA